jgi:diguanylate cyclase (GGDEF)-like protein
LKKGHFFGIIIGLSQKQKMGNRPNENKGSRKRQNNGDLLPFVTGDPEAGNGRLEMSPSMDDIVQRHGISELRKAVRGVIDLKKEAEKMSASDKLTGLPNRRAYDSQIEKEMARAKRDGKPLSVLMLDIDRFKNVNDTYGHSVGDETLARVAKILKDNLHRTVDFVARYGGEEMIVVLPETDSSGAMKVAEMLRKAVKRDSKILAQDKNGKPAEFIVTVSVGCTTFDPILDKANEELSNPSTIKNSADNALLRSKGGGRNRSTAYNAEIGIDEGAQENADNRQIEMIERDLSGRSPEERVDLLEKALAREKAKIKKSGTNRVRL